MNGENAAKEYVFYQYVTTQIISDISITSFGQLKSKDGSSHAAQEERNLNSVHYVLSGRGTYILNNKRYELCAGDMFFIPADNSVEYFSDPDDPYEYLWIAFSGSKAKSFCQLAKFTAEDPVYHTNSPRIEETFKEILEISDDSVSAELLVLAVLCKVFAYLMDDRQSTAPRRKRCQEEYVYNATEYIKLHLSDKDLCLDAISREVKISPSHLSAVFKAQTGQTINGFILSMRIAKACALLSDGEKPVNVIASEVGFSDARHFSKMFKKYIGSTPSRYLPKAKVEI